MEFNLREHRHGDVYTFIEEVHHKTAIQPKFVMVGGGLTFRLPRVQDKAKLYADITEDEPGSIRWYSRTGNQVV